MGVFPSNVRKLRSRKGGISHKRRQNETIHHPHILAQSHAHKQRTHGIYREHFHIRPPRRCLPSSRYLHPIVQNLHVIVELSHFILFCAYTLRFAAPFHTLFLLLFTIGIYSNATPPPISKVVATMVVLMMT